MLFLLACRAPPVQVVAVDDRGPLPTDPAIRGRDGGYSAAIDGLSVWAHGDTILATAGVNGNWLNSSVSWTADLDASDGIDGFQQDLDATGAPAQFFPVQDDVIWAGSLIQRPAGGALVAWLRLPTEGDETTGLATWAGPGTQPALGEAVFGPSIRVNSALLEHDGMLYGFGCQSAGLAKPCVLGRVDFERAQQTAAWTFWDGGAWSTDPDDAKAVFDGNDIVSVHRSETSGRLIAVYSEPLGRAVFLRTADVPEGPWSKPVRLFEAELGEEGDLPYSAVAHGELAYADGAGWTEVITYHRGTGPFQSELVVVHVTLDAS